MKHGEKITFEFEAFKSEIMGISKRAAEAVEGRGYDYYLYPV